MQLVGIYLKDVDNLFIGVLFGRPKPLYLIIFNLCYLQEQS